MAREMVGELTAVAGRYAIVVAQYNRSITDKLLAGALQTLQQHGVADEDLLVVRVPGAWELPLAAQRLARRSGVSAVLCLGAVIRGETTHDQHINRQVSDSLGRIALQADVPVLFGVLTCNSMEQAIHRAGGNVGNKGVECAEAALQMASLMRQLGEPPKSDTRNPQ